MIAPAILTLINCPAKPVTLAKPLTTVPGKFKLVSKLSKRAIFNSVNPELRFQVMQIEPQINFNRGVTQIYQIVSILDN